MSIRPRNARLGTVAALCATILVGCDAPPFASPAPPEAITYGEETAVDFIDGQPKVVDGRVAFAGPDEANAYTEPLLTASTAELVAAEERLGGFLSLRAYLDPNLWTEETAAAAGDSEELTGSAATALERDGVTREDFPVSDAFLSLVNSRGEVQLGDRVYKLTRDNVYEVKPEDLPVLNEAVPTLSSPAPAEPDPRIAVYPVETTDEPVEEAPAFSVSGGTGPSRIRSFKTSPCSVPAGRWRMHGKSYITTAVIYVEAGVRTNWERRMMLWLWFPFWQEGTLEHRWYANLYVDRVFWRDVHLYGPATGSHPPTPRTAGIHSTLAARWVWPGARLRGRVQGEHSVDNSTANGTCWTDVAA